MKTKELDIWAEESLKILKENGYLNNFPTSEYPKKTRDKYKAVFAILCIVLVSVFLIFLSFQIYDGKLKSYNNNTCMNFNNIPQCPVFPDIPKCPTLECPNQFFNISINPIIKITNSS